MNKLKRKKKRKLRAKQLSIGKISTDNWNKIPKTIKKTDSEGNTERVMNPEWYKTE